MIKIELNRLLREKKISQSELAALSGVRRARINELCHEKNIARLETKHIDAICNALDVEPWEWIVWKMDV